MPWLADTDVGAAYGFARSIVGARTEAELRRRVLPALAELVPADVLTWDRVELATGAVDHVATPDGAEPPGAFEAVVPHAAGHPLLAAHVARRLPAVRLSEVVEPGALTRGELYGDLLHAAGMEYEIAIGVPAVAARRSMRGSAAPNASSPSATATCSTSPVQGLRVRCGPRRRTGASSARSLTILRPGPR